MLNIVPLFTYWTGSYLVKTVGSDWLSQCRAGEEMRGGIKLDNYDIDYSAAILRVLIVLCWMFSLRPVGARSKGR